MRAQNDDDLALLEHARQAAARAYCPYSHFLVGAAVETELGRFTGSNVENASYSLGICAERVAIHSAISAGARKLSRLAVSCQEALDSESPASRMPCGACRQVMAEFMTSDAEVTIDGIGVWTMEDLLPQAFRLAEL